MFRSKLWVRVELVPLAVTGALASVSGMCVRRAAWGACGRGGQVSAEGSPASWGNGWDVQGPISHAHP